MPTGTPHIRVVRAQLVATLVNGSSIVIAKTQRGKWQTTEGPIISDDIYNGEHYDARLEQNGWAEPGFKPVSSAHHPQWHTAAVIATADAPRGEMVAWSAPPVTVSRIVAPVKIWKNAPPPSATCAIAKEMIGPAKINLACPPRQAISDVLFAFYGTPTGDCTVSPNPFHAGRCDSNSSLRVVRAACLNRMECKLAADCHDAHSCVAWGGDPCFGVHKSLAVQVNCSDASKMKNVTKPPVVHTVDFGTNVAGVCRLKGITGGKVGEVIEMVYAEVLEHKGGSGSADDRVDDRLGRYRAAFCCCSAF